MISRIRLFSLALVLCAGSPELSAQETETIHFVHTGAINGYIAPPDGTGGWSRIAGYVRGLQARNENVFLFDCGDALWGSGAALVTGGEAPVRLANATGYDALLLGNLDVNSKSLDKLVVPVLLGHSDFYGGYGNINIAVPSKLIRKGSLSIGVIGALYGPPSGDGLYRIHEEEIAELKEQGANLIVLLAHDAIDRDWTKYAEMGVNIVLAHWSQFAPPSQEELETSTGMEFSYTRGVFKGRNLSHLTVQMQPDGTFTTVADSTVMFALDSVADPSVDRVAKQENERVERVLNNVIGRADTDIRHSLGSTSPAGELVLDAIDWHTDADLVVYNSPGVRSGLRSGEIRYSHLVDMLPFGNHVVIAELTGAQIIDLYQKRNRNVLLKGLREEPRTGAVYIGEHAVVEDRSYRVATNNYLVENGEGPFEVLKESVNRVYANSDLEMLCAYIRKRGVL